MSRWVRFAVMCLCFLAATLVVGWWGLAIVGAVTGYVLGPRSRVGWIAAGAAASGWVVLLAWNATRGPTGELAQLVGATMGVPGVVLAVLTLVFAATVAGLSASVAAELAYLSGPPQPSSSKLRRAQAPRPDKRSPSAAART